MRNKFEADSIRKTFGDRQVLTDIFLSCQTGDIIGLLGRNGSGKSTLLKILYGTLYTDYKHISVNGVNLDQPFKKQGVIVKEFQMKLSWINSARNTLMPKPIIWSPLSENDFIPRQTLPVYQDFGIT